MAPAGRAEQRDGTTWGEIVDAAIVVLALARDDLVVTSDEVGRR